MDKENWKIIESIYDQAELLETEEQQTFVKDQSDGNTDVYHQVMKMLNTDAEGFMQNFPGEIAELHDFDTAEPIQLGHFKIIKKIATGGMGRVYLAQSTMADVPIKVALKTIRIELINDELKRKFQNEKNILSKLQHKNIASLIDAGVTENQIPYIATEWVNGKNIKDYCIQNNLTIKKRLKIFLQICDAMTFAHNKLIIHRDLKPDNILVNDHEQVKLLDFGIAKIVDENQKVQTHTQIFTPDYAAPEQLSGEMCTAATDIYSLGIILFEMLTNSKRFNLAGLAIAEKIKAIALPKLADLSDVQPEHKLVYSVSNLKGALYTIINKAMHVDPNRRYNSVSSLVIDIENYLENRPIKAMNDSFIYKTKMLLLRNKLASTFLALAFIGITSGLIIANKQLDLKDKEVRKTRTMLNFIDNILITASPVQGGTLNMTVREMFLKGIDDFDLNALEGSYEKAEIANRIGLLYSELEQQQESTEYFQIAVNFYKKNLSEDNNASAYLQNSMSIANKLIVKNDGNIAINYIENAIEKVKNYPVKPNQMGLAYIYLARTYGIKGINFNKTKAFENYAIAESIVNKMNENNGKKHSLLGEINFYKQIHFNDTNNYDEATGYLNKAEFHFNKSLDSEYNPNLNAVMTSKANLFSRSGQLEKAEIYFDKSNQYRYQIYSKYSYVTLTNQAKNYFRMGLFTDALASLKQAEDIFLQDDIIKDLNYYGLLLNKTNALVGMERYENVQKYFLDILTYMRGILPGNHYIIKIVLNDQATFYLKTEDTARISLSKLSLIKFLEINKEEPPLTDAVRLPVLINLANFYLFEKGYESALKYFILANEITANEIEKHNQGWLYWQLQTGLELAKLKISHSKDISDFSLAKKQLLDFLAHSAWHDKFYVLN